MFEFVTLTDHEYEYYRHWPYEIDPRWEKEHHMLRSLTMREHASVMVGSLGAYYADKGDHPAALRWDALAHWLDPANYEAETRWHARRVLLEPKLIS